MSPFAKGNTIWKESHKARKEKDDKLDKFLLIRAAGGTEKYGDLIDKLANNEKLSKSQEQFMDRFEGWREYIKPKLARTEGTVTHKGLNPILDAINDRNKQ